MVEHNDSLVVEIGLFIEYAVPQNERKQAGELLQKYRNNLMLLRLLKEYYRTLPEAREEAAIKISRLRQKEGVYLFVLVTPNRSYLYAVSMEDVLWLGIYREEVSVDILAYFDFSSMETFLKKCPETDELKPFPGDGAEGAHSCPVCGVEESDTHLLGCIVEICPWCQGQLSGCPCRFEQLGVEEIEDEEHLEEFATRLEQKGRIPYSRGQAPTYPGTSKGLDK